MADSAQIRHVYIVVTPQRLKFGVCVCVCVRVCVCVYALLLRKSWGIVEFVGIIMGLEVTTKNDCRDVGRLQVAMHRSRIRYLSKKNSRILTNFAKLKKNS